MSLRECLRLQVVPQYCTILMTPFGRAKLLTGEHPIYSEQPDAYMLYWLKLPVFQHRHHVMYDLYCMQQAVLMWHGKHGFRVIWEPVREAFDAG